MEPEELYRSVLKTLVYLRGFLLETAISLACLVFVLYWFAPDILNLLQYHLGQKLAFFGVMEPVVSLLKLSTAAALAIMAPWIFFRLSQGLIAIFGITKRFAILFSITALFLFYGGAAFCFFVTLPFGVNFLLGYQSQNLTAVISLGKFVDFVALFLLGFGLIFELPLIMSLACKLGICSPMTFSRQRRYAVLIIAILAAVLTPTPDVLNMSLMAVPLYLLYEAGIIIGRLFAPSS